MNEQKPIQVQKLLLINFLVAQYDIVWSIDSIGGNNLKRTKLTDIPQLGALSMYAGKNEMDETVSYLVWDIESSNY